VGAGGVDRMKYDLAAIFLTAAAVLLILALVIGWLR
jgi:hypothetical protein